MLGAHWRLDACPQSPVPALSPALRCLALCENPQTSTFIEMVKHAYGGYMTTVIGDQVLNAYHLMNPRPIGFVSNNQVAADRRGGPRPRRRRKKNPNGDAADSSSRNQEHANTGGASASAGPSSASCAAALPDPVYVTVNPANQPGFNGQWRMKMPPWQEQEVFGPSGLLPHMDEEASAHTPRNQHHLPIGKGNGGQTPKGWHPLP